VQSPASVFRQRKLLNRLPIGKLPAERVIRALPQAFLVIRVRLGPGATTLRA